MTKFIVGVECTIGEYEKRTIHLVEAKTKQQAMLQALADESHGYGRLDEDGIWWDVGGEMAYKVDHCEKITEKQYEAVKKLEIIYLSHYSPNTIKEMIDDDEETDIDTLLGYLQ